MVEVKCPLCHSRFETDGPKAECPDCGEVFYPGGEPPKEKKAAEPVKEKEPEPEPKPVSKPQPEPKPEPEERKSAVEKMLERTPPAPPPRREASREPERQPKPVVAARGKPPSRRPVKKPAPVKGPAPAKKKPDLAYIPFEFRVPKGFVPPEPERPVKKAVRPRPKRRVAPADTPVRPVQKVKPKRVKRPLPPPPDDEEPEPREGGIKPIPRRTSDLPVWKTRSGLAGIFLVIVFILALAQAMMMIAADDGPAEGGGRADILGTVVDTEGSKVVGAIVTLDGGEVAYTDGSGSFYYDSVKTGDHTIAVDADGYETSSWRTTVSGSNRYVVITVGPVERNVDDTSDLERRDSSIPMIALIFVLFGGIAFVGGVFALRGLGRTIPMIGAVAGMVSIGLFAGTVLAVLALILLIFSEKEFVEIHRCAACTGVIGGDHTSCSQCGAEYHPACARGEGECVVCGNALR